jgi:hypothetical protein
MVETNTAQSFAATATRYGVLRLGPSWLMRPSILSFSTRDAAKTYARWTPWEDVAWCIIGFSVLLMIALHHWIFPYSLWAVLLVFLFASVPSMAKMPFRFSGVFHWADQNASIQAGSIYKGAVIVCVIDRSLALTVLAQIFVGLGVAGLVRTVAL